MANPPITVGELVDVPAPGSEIDAQFHQEVAHRICHRFASTTAMNAWAAANGSLAFVTANSTHYQRVSGAWKALAGTAYVDSKVAAVQAELDSTQSDLASTDADLAKLPTGLISRTFNTAAITIGTSSTVIVTAPAFTASSTRWYRIVANVPRVTGGAAQDVTIVIEKSDGTDQRIQLQSFVAGGDQSGFHLELVVSGLSGSQTFRIAGACNTSSATVPISAGNISNAMITVEDMGAV